MEWQGLSRCLGLCEPHAGWCILRLDGLTVSAMLASGSALCSIGMLPSPKGALLGTQCHPQMRPGCLKFAQAFILGKRSSLSGRHQSAGANMLQQNVFCPRSLHGCCVYRSLTDAGRRDPPSEPQAKRTTRHTARGDSNTWNQTLYKMRNLCYVDTGKYQALFLLFSAVCVWNLFILRTVMVGTCPEKNWW